MENQFRLSVSPGIFGFGLAFQAFFLTRSRTVEAGRSSLNYLSEKNFFFLPLLCEVKKNIFAKRTFSSVIKNLESEQKKVSRRPPSAFDVNLANKRAKSGAK